jgi:hypothetical protein
MKSPMASHPKVKKFLAGSVLCILFAGVTLLQTFPLSLDPAHAVYDPGDPLLNVWILSWVGEHLVQGPFRLFEANIFYPYHQTLAFSEHLLPLSILSAPVYFLSRNPILRYNLLLYLTFVLNALGMFFLVGHLTRNKWAGVVSGLIFSFSAFKIMHISHLQLLSSMGIPWCFLYLHKWMADKTWKDAVLFSFFFMLQALSCVYYGLFSMVILVLILPLFLLFNKRSFDLPSLAKLAAPLVLAGGILYAFSLPYLRVFRALGLKRGLAAGAEVQNYLAVVPTNLLFGRLLSGWGEPERYLFPGLAACVLMIVAIAGRRTFAARADRSGIVRRIDKVANILFLILVAANLLSLVVALAGGVSFAWGGLKFSANRAEKPLLFLFVLGALFLAAKVVERLRARPEADRSAWILGYSILAFWAALLSFGAVFTLSGKSTTAFPMPFPWFFRHVTGFDGIREPVRISVFVLFGISVLAGFGWERILAKMTKKAWRGVLTGALLVFINLEYLSIPIEGISVPVGKDLPPTYAWLKEQGKEAVVLELPFAEWIPCEALYLYFSTYHKKRIVNGYSGFIPASAYWLKETFRKFPDPESLRLLEALHVDFVVFHTKLLPPAFVPGVAAQIESLTGGELRLAARFQYPFSRPNTFKEFLGDDLVFSVHPERAFRKSGPAEESPAMAEIPSDQWRITVSQNQLAASLMTDKDLASGWTSEKAIRPGEFIQIDLGKARDVRRVSIFGGATYYDYGLDFQMEISDDGAHWRPVPSRFSKAEFCLSLIADQVHANQDLWLEGGPARYLKIIQTGKSEAFSWSVSELRIFERLPSAGRPAPNEAR